MFRVLLVLLLLLPFNATAQAPPEPPLEYPEPVADEYYWAIVNWPPDPLPAPDRVIVCPDQKAARPRLLFRDYVESSFGGNSPLMDESDQFQSVRYQSGEMLALGTRWGNLSEPPKDPRVWVVHVDGQGRTRSNLLRPPLDSGGDWEVDGWVDFGSAIRLTASDGEHGSWTTTLDSRLRSKRWIRQDSKPANASSRPPVELPPMLLGDEIVDFMGADNEKTVDWSARLTIRFAASKPDSLIAFRLPSHGWTTDGKPSDSEIRSIGAWSRPGVPARVFLLRSIGDFERGRLFDEEFWILQPDKEPHCRKLIDGSTLAPDATVITHGEALEDGSLLFHGWGYRRNPAIDASLDRVVWVGHIDRNILDGPPNPAR